MCTWAVTVGAEKRLELLPQVAVNLTCSWLLTGIFEETDCSEAGNHWHNCRPSILLIIQLSYYGLCRSEEGTLSSETGGSHFISTFWLPQHVQVPINHSLLFLARWLSRLRHCATRRKVAVSIFGWYKPTGSTMALVSTHTVIFPEGKGCRGVGVTNFMCRLSWNLGFSTSWNPQGLFRYWLIFPALISLEHLQYSTVGYSTVEYSTIK